MPVLPAGLYSNRQGVCLSKNLLSILKGINYTHSGVLPEKIEKITCSSKDTVPGALFFAIRGEKADGHNFITEAINNGARALVVEEIVEPTRVPQIIVSDTKAALSRAAANFFDHPTQTMTIVGVTGTNGKTTTVYLLNHILITAGYRCGTVGTLGYSIDDQWFPSNLTTPDSITVQSIFAKMHAKNVSVAVMEVSSHSLALHRVADIRFQGGVFTNISQDHLDFHKSLTDYAQTKARLFQIVDPSGFLVYNCDDNYAQLFMQSAKARAYSFALSPKADYHWLSGVEFNNGISGTIHTPTQNIAITSKLSGEFNLRNILGVVAVAENLGIAPAIIKKSLSEVPFIPGRLQEISQSGQPRVFIDYAHTPDAISNVLKTLRSMVTAGGRLIVVFGCGGNRDKSKRPLMAQAVEKFADLAVVTTDNPRFEEPHAIMQDIIPGFSKSYPYLLIEDRREAIRQALSMAQPLDIVAILGKGHEPYQEIKGVRHPFHDSIIVKEYFNAAGS